MGYMNELAAQQEEEEGKRIIIIGDNRGCYDELCQVLEKAGDFVNKGPKSAHVVRSRLARQVVARVVVDSDLTKLLGELTYRDLSFLAREMVASGWIQLPQDRNCRVPC